MNEDINDKKIDNEEEITQTTSQDEVAIPSENEVLEHKVKELEQKYLRTYADFENYRKRVAKEKEEVRQSTSELLLRELLEVKDHLEMALSHAKETSVSPELKSLREGVGLTLKQLQNFLKKFGVDEINPLGEPFNPEFHEAIQQEAVAGFAPGAVSRVFQKGYVMNGRLLRPARVAVAQG